MQLECVREDQATGIAMVRRAIERGIDHIDTTHFYGYGLSNDLIRRALTPADDFALLSRVGAASDRGGPFPMRAAQRPEERHAEVEADLTSLGAEQLAVVNLRRIDVGATIPGPDEEEVGIEDQLAEMTAMRDEGLIGAIGLSSISIDELRQGLPAGIDCVQDSYSLIARGDDDVLELCESEGIAWGPFCPLGSGFGRMPKATDDADVAQVAAELGASTSQVGLGWLLHRSLSILLFSGTASIDHLEENTAVGDIECSPEQLAALDAIPNREPGTIRG
jgi:pyridoxine 4-dehydrogenase